VRDLLFIAVVVAFFAIAALFVVGCQRLLGSGDDVETREVRTEDLIGLVLAVVVLAYLEPMDVGR
jgi:hypothetical protein